MRGALRVDGLHLHLQLREIGLRHAHVIAGVVADLEAVPVQLTDLIPGEVVLLVRPEGEPLGDEERRAEPVLLEQRPDDRVVTRLGVVEGQHDELVRDRFQNRSAGQHRQ
jgi:hypothetical protein